MLDNFFNILETGMRQILVTWRQQGLDDSKLKATVNHLRLRSEYWNLTLWWIVGLSEYDRSWWRLNPLHLLQIPSNKSHIQVICDHLMIQKLSSRGVKKVWHIYNTRSIQLLCKGNRCQTWKWQILKCICKDLHLASCPIYPLCSLLFLF